MTIHTDRPTTASIASRRRSADGSGDGDDRTDADAVAADDSIPQVAVRRVLNSDRRRELLRCLLAADESLALPTLVARIADAEHDATAVTSLLELRQRVHVSLCRTHLPLLENYRVLAYDEGHGRVAPGARLSAFRSALEFEPLDGPAGARPSNL